MKIWYFDIWGAVPIKGEDRNRPFRQNMIVDYLSQKGHDITWFTSTFNHRTKTFRTNKITIIEDKNKKIVLIHPSIGYSSNISIKRILNHINISNKINIYIQNLEKPDVVISSYPAIEVANVAINYANKYNIPSIIDVRDLWPDLFESVFPKGTKKLGKILLSPYYLLAKKIFSQATAITGVTDEFVNFGLTYANREKKYDKSFPFGYPDFELSKEDETMSKEKLEQNGVDFNKNIFCYFGSLGKTADFSHIIEVAKRLEKENIQFVIGGLGDQLENLKKIVPTNILFLGWIEKNEIWTIMKYAKAGIVPFVKNDNFEKNLTNKMIEYLAGGLPILSNINGLLGNILKTYNCGFVYNSSTNLLLDSIKQLLENKQLQKEMSINARKVFENNFLADKVYGDFVLYIESIYKNFKG